MEIMISNLRGPPVPPRTQITLPSRLAFLSYTTISHFLPCSPSSLLVENHASHFTEKVKASRGNSLPTGTTHLSLDPDLGPCYWTQTAHAPGKASLSIPSIPFPLTCNTASTTLPLSPASFSSLLNQFYQYNNIC